MVPLFAAANRCTKQVFTVTAADFATAVAYARNGTDVGDQLAAQQKGRRLLQLPDSSSASNSAQPAKDLSNEQLKQKAQQHRRALKFASRLSEARRELLAVTSPVPESSWLGTFSRADVQETCPEVYADLAARPRNKWGDALEGMDIQPMRQMTIAKDLP